MRTSVKEANMSTMTVNAIPREVAIRLCADIQVENRYRWYTPAGNMCHGCLAYSRGDPARMCFASRPDNRGCYQVNARYDQHVPTS
jgi:hypothetical protein